MKTRLHRKAAMQQRSGETTPNSRRPPRLCGSCFLSILVGLVAVGCAINDVPTPSPVPPVEFVSPPTATPIFTGSCNQPSEFETWLQMTSLVLQSFQERLNLMQGKEKSQLSEDIQVLLALRDTLTSVPVPDCAAEAQPILNRALSDAIDAYQVYAGSGSLDIGTTLSAIQAKLDEATAIHTQLIARLKFLLQETPTG